MNVAYIGVVIMQRSRPGDYCFEPLFKALHHPPRQFVHAEIAFRVLCEGVGTEFKAVEIPPLFRRLIYKLVGFMSPQKSGAPKK
jgi:hypothetical protein